MTEATAAISGPRLVIMVIRSNANNIDFMWDKENVINLTSLLLDFTSTYACHNKEIKMCFWWWCPYNRQQRRQPSSYVKKC